MPRTVHLCVDIAGALRWRDRKLAGMFRNDDGSEMLGREVRATLNRCLDEGKRVLPFGEPFEGFSYLTGCPGHETPSGDAPQPATASTSTRRWSVAEQTQGKGREFYILSLHCMRDSRRLTACIWWKPDACGYTSYLDEAGRYSAAEVEADLYHCNHGENTLAVPCDVVDAMRQEASTVPGRYYFRRPEAPVVRNTPGRLNKLRKAAPYPAQYNPSPAGDAQPSAPLQRPHEQDQCRPAPAAGPR